MKVKLRFKRWWRYALPVTMEFMPRDGVELSLTRWLCFLIDVRRPAGGAGSGRG